MSRVDLAAMAPALARLEALRGDALRMRVEDFAAEHVQLGGFAWEALRNTSDRQALARWAAEPRLAAAAAALARDGDLHRFCDALEPLWRRRPALAVTPLLLASALLLEHTPAELWLAIEGGPLLCVLSPMYRELRIRAYNHGVVLLGPGAREDLRRPRWQPFLGGVAFHRGYSLVGRPDVLRAFVGIHELAHLATITAPPRDPARGVPRAYLDWILGNEAVAVAIQQWVEYEVLTRVAHPFLVGVFNTAPSQRGHQIPPRLPAAQASREFVRQTAAIVEAMQSLIVMVTEQRMPDDAVLRTITSGLTTAQGFVQYALEEWPVLSLGQRGDLLRACLPPAPAGLAPSGLARFVAVARDVRERRSVLAPGERERAVRARAWLLRAWRAAELHDQLYHVDPAATEFAELAGLVGARLHGAALGAPAPPQDAELTDLFTRVLPRVRARWVPRRYLELDPGWVFLAEGSGRAFGPES